MSYHGRIGLEVHIGLKTKSKLFCRCPTEWTDNPNVHICDVCLGYPGSMPRLNRSALIQGIKIVQSLGMEIPRYFRMDRKHYRYPDLSKSYQTSQYYSTIGRKGSLEIEVRGKKLSIQIREAHIEEDAGRLVHVGEESMVDFNRAGVPLVEIVTEPDFHIGEEVEAFLRYLQLLVRTIGASDASMELGQMRCDTNVSVSQDVHEWGVRTELKNINSPKFVKLAIDYEIQRQIDILEARGQILQETLRWNENRGRTELMRTKEMVQDYRYLPEPDLAVISLNKKELEEIKNSISELPNAKLERFISSYRLNRGTAAELISDIQLANYFEKCIEVVKDTELVANWLLNQVKMLLNRRNISLSDSKLDVQRLSELLISLKEERISGVNAAKVLSIMLDSDDSPLSIIKLNDLEQISDESHIRAWVHDILQNNKDAVEKFKRGEIRVFQFLLGQVQKISKGKANPRIVKVFLEQALPVTRLCIVDMGGAISAVRDSEGVLVSAERSVLQKMLNKIVNKRADLQMDIKCVSRELSENILPSDWFNLLNTLTAILKEGVYQGVVVTHGLDTLAYTASFIYWLMSRISIPVVFTGSTKGPEDDDSDALSNLARSVEFASKNENMGVWVCMDKHSFPAVNFQMTGIAASCMETKNIPKDQMHTLHHVSEFYQDIPKIDLESLEKVVSQTLIIKIYPGLNPAWLEHIVESGVRYVLIELYDTGTANTRWGSTDSLLRLIKKVRANDGAVFGTSQLGIPVRLSDYESSKALWNAGMVPLGRLVTESAFTKLIVLQLLEKNSERIVEKMIREEFAL